MSPLPLEGLKVLDLTRLLPGGFCSLLLADFGADVIKVEDTGLGDYVRWAPPYYEGAEPSARSALFLGLNRGKRSIRIDLKSDQGKQVLLRLVRDVDVVLESFRPGVMERLGVGYERLRQENPGLVYCAITGYGQDGPDRDRPGHDLNYLGLNGILGLTGEAGGPPVPAAAQIADLGGGRSMAVSRDPRRAPGARSARARGSWSTARCSTARCRGSRCSRLRCSPTAALPAAASSRLAGGIVCYRPYRCADGYVTLGALEPKFWAAFCHGVGREDLLEHAFDRPGSEAHRAVCEIFAARTRAGVGARSAPSTTAAWSPCSDLDEVLERGARRRTGDGRRARPAGRGSAGQAARRAGQAEPDAGQPRAGAGPRSRRAHPRRAGPGGLLAPGDRRAA